MIDEILHYDNAIGLFSPSAGVDLKSLQSAGEAVGTSPQRLSPCVWKFLEDEMSMLGRNDELLVSTWHSHLVPTFCKAVLCGLLLRAPPVYLVSLVPDIWGFWRGPEGLESRVFMSSNRV